MTYNDDENVISCKAHKNKKFKNLVTFVKNIPEHNFFGPRSWFGPFDFIIAYLNVFRFLALRQVGNDPFPAYALTFNMDKFSQFKKVRACNSKNPAQKLSFSSSYIPPSTNDLDLRLFKNVISSTAQLEINNCEKIKIYHTWGR